MKSWPLTLRKPTLTEGSRPAFEAGRKLGVVEMALVWQVLHEEPQCPSRVVLDKVAQRHVPIAVSVRHLNRLWVKWNLNRRKGRPGQTAWSRPVCASAAVVQVTPHLSCVGVHLFAHWLDQHDAFGPVVAQLRQAIEAHERAQPDDDFALLHHREQTLLGRGYHSSALSQFLAQLERIAAAEALMPALVPDTVGKVTSVDGHMIAYWSRRSMHKGKITMLGRIMAGSHAVIAHNEAGQALFVAYYPPDIHLSQVIVEYCQKVALATESVLFVIDRAVNAVALTCAFDARGWGLLCMLDDKEYEGLDSFEATEVGTLADGTKVYSGTWQVPRLDDPRHFVIVAPAAGKTLVYWGTPQVKAAVAALEWPRLYRERNEIQENGFKRMIDHGALNTQLWAQDNCRP
jgi:hypothetical protein